MYKMLFDTGVKPHNHPFLLEHDEWVNGTLHKVVYLESEPPKQANFIGLCNEPQAGEVAIQVVSGGTLAKFAVYRLWPAM